MNKSKRLKNKKEKRSDFISIFGIIACCISVCIAVETNKSDLSIALFFISAAIFMTGEVLGKSGRLPQKYINHMKNYDFCYTKKFGESDFEPCIYSEPCSNCATFSCSRSYSRSIVFDSEPKREIISEYGYQKAPNISHFVLRAYAYGIDRLNFKGDKEFEFSTKGYLKDYKEIYVETGFCGSDLVAAIWKYNKDKTDENMDSIGKKLDETVFFVPSTSPSMYNEYLTETIHASKNAAILLAKKAAKEYGGKPALSNGSVNESLLKDSVRLIYGGRNYNCNIKNDFNEDSMTFKTAVTGKSSYFCGFTDVFQIGRMYSKSGIIAMTFKDIVMHLGDKVKDDNDGLQGFVINPRLNYMSLILQSSDCAKYAGIPLPAENKKIENTTFESKVKSDKLNLKRIRESNMGDKSVFITYKTGKINNALKIINLLKNNMELESVTLEETCELDMMTFGERTYRIDVFVSDYDFIRTLGRDVVLSIDGKKDGVKLSVGVCEDNDILTLSIDSDSPDIIAAYDLKNLLS